MAGWRRIAKSGPKATDMRQLPRREVFLGRYLEDLYLHEVKLHISEDECGQLQRGVETIVSNIVNEIAISEPKLSIRPENILNVGSYYERTKICYPDEFDYIVVLQTFSPNPEHDEYERDKAMKGVKKQMELYPWYLKRAVSHLERKDDIGINLKSGKLTLDTELIQQQGPATKLHVNYIKNNGIVEESMSIEVDITAAVRVDGLPTDGLTDRAPCKQLLQMARGGGSHLIIFNYNVDLPFIETFTETEMDYMVNVMSEGHKKAYMVLKYLVNGKHTTEKEKYHIFSSYAIKTIMYEHHSECTDESDMSVCVLNVLKTMYGKLKTSLSNIPRHSLKRPICVWHNACTGRSFSKTLGTEVVKRKRALKWLIDHLDKEMQQTTPEYSYQTCYVQPLIEFF